MSERQMLSSCVVIARQFLRSVRIDADLAREDALDGYVMQPTARAALENTARQIAQTHQRAFTWTGPYGCGKSSLALALALLAGGEPKLRAKAKKVLGIEAREAIGKVFGGNRGWLVLPVVGRRSSVREEIAAAIDASGAPKKRGRHAKGGRDIIDEMIRLAASSRQSGVLVLIDELGKFLEHAAATGEDIYFYQQLAEAASRAEGNLVVVGILHQSFEQYASRLGQGAREEWAKVQGRFVDIPLLAGSDETIALIGRAIEHSSTEAPRKAQLIAKTVASVIRSRRPSTSATLAEALVNCWPLHPVTAALLGPSAKRRFGQNERSIFGFLASAEPLAFREFLASSPATALYTPAMYWDYLNANLEAAILSSPDGHRWSLGAEAVERAQARFSSLHVQLVKSAALIDLFRNGSGLAAQEDLLAGCVGEDRKAVVKALEQLAMASILIYRKHLQAWSVYAGSDFDIEAAVRARLADRFEPDLKQLSALGELHPITARRHYAVTGTMRWFSRVLARPSDIQKTLEAFDGKGASGAFVLLIPSSTDEVRGAARLAEQSTANRLFEGHVVGVPKNADRLVELSLELEALQAIRAAERKVHDDPVARRELDARIAATSGALADELRDAFLTAEWYWHGKQCEVRPVEGLSRLASRVADQLYRSAPHLHSELVNRDELSSSAAKAQRELMHRMLSHADLANLGYEGYPAEAGLYYSLLKPAGLHRNVDGRWRISSPDEATARGHSLRPLWDYTWALVSKHDGTVCLADIYAAWRDKPFGVRRGSMPILATAFFLANRSSLALYVDATFTPELNDADLDEWLQDARRISWRFVKVEESAKRMLAALAATLRDKLGRPVAADPLDAARGLVRLVYNLPEWARRTNSVSADAKRMRDLLLKASDPHKVIFADLPIALGVPADLKMVERVAKLAQELEAAFPDALRQVERRLLETLDHAQNLDGLRTRARVVQGISGDYRLDAFAGRLSVYTGSLADIEGVVMLALNKPTSQWVDNDIDAAVLQLCNWAIEFRRVEALASVRGRPATRRAIAVVFGSTAERGSRTVSGTFDIATADAPEVDRVVSELMATFVQKNVKREVVLAALAEMGARLFDQERIAGTLTMGEP